MRNGSNVRRGLGTLLIASLVVIVAGCGSSSSDSTTVRLTPAQYDNERRIETYGAALRVILAPFAHPQANPEDFTHADRLLRRSVTELRRLDAPSALASLQRSLIRATEDERRALAELVRAKRTHDAVGVSNAEAHAARAGNTTRQVLKEVNAVYAKCRAERFTC